MLNFCTKSILIKIWEDPCNRKHPFSLNATTKKEGQCVVFAKEAIVWNCLSCFDHQRRYSFTSFY
jgi:hypothetical protein